MVMVKGKVIILSEKPTDLVAHGVTQLLALFHRPISIRLVSLSIDPATNEGKISQESKFNLLGGTKDGDDSILDVSFKVDKDFGKPGAILLETIDKNEFYIKSITLTMPNNTIIHFPCYTWINHKELYFGKQRVFFSNEAYLPNNTPKALLKYREADLLALQGDGKDERIYGQRIYDYDVYNDLGNVDSDETLKRPILGGSKEYPYPRRCRTGRKHTRKDPSFEEPQTSFDNAYVPRDERFASLKMGDFLKTGVVSMGQNVISNVLNMFDNESFDNLEEVQGLYEGGLKKPISVKQSNGEAITIAPKFPPPGIVSINKEAWKLDSEFGRQRLAGVNPLVIQRLMDFPPKSTLDTKLYGDQLSSIKREHIEPLMEGLSVEKALEYNLLYILDYHDAMLPFINKINELEGKTYASRTILYLNKSNELVPIAIELTLPPQQECENANHSVFTPKSNPWLWHFAKTHVSITDTGFHQLVSHWLRTHASIEPIIISSKRNLSKMHPLYMLLEPHFKDTMHINALARSSLINAGGKIEGHFTPGKYCMEISSVVYKDWRFDEQGLPKDLLKRGMAVEDPNAKYGLRLTIEDYPYALDGLDLWEAMKKWVKDYVKLYYDNDSVVEGDIELQRWWKEIKEVGHGDHARAQWWPNMEKVENLVDVISTIIWLTSAHHAAVNFGQYAYAGYMPNSPCMARKLIPEEGTTDYQAMLQEPEKFLLEMLPSQGDTTLAMAVLETLATHMSGETYLGERIDPNWTSDPRAKNALQEFRNNLKIVEADIESRNASFEKLHHRAGSVHLPYTLLTPYSPELGLTFRGVPNSISI